MQSTSPSFSLLVCRFANQNDNAQYSHVQEHHRRCLLRRGYAWRFHPSITLNICVFIRKKFFFMYSTESFESSIDCFEKVSVSLQMVVSSSVEEDIVCRSSVDAQDTILRPLLFTTFVQPTLYFNLPIRLFARLKWHRRLASEINVSAVHIEASLPELICEIVNITSNQVYLSHLHLFSTSFISRMTIFSGDHSGKSSLIFLIRPTNIFFVSSIKFCFSTSPLSNAFDTRWRVLKPSRARSIAATGWNEKRDKHRLRFNRGCEGEKKEYYTGCLTAISNGRVEELWSSRVRKTWCCEEMRLNWYSTETCEQKWIITVEHCSNSIVSRVHDYMLRSYIHRFFLSRSPSFDWWNQEKPERSTWNEWMNHSSFILGYR